LNFVPGFEAKRAYQICIHVRGLSFPGKLYIIFEDFLADLDAFVADPDIAGSGKESFRTALRAK